MRHSEKTVTIYQKRWDKEKAADTYRGTVLVGVSFFSKLATTVTTDGLVSACEATLRIPAELLSAAFVLKNGDLVCEGKYLTNPAGRMAIDAVCGQVYTIVGITNNTSGREPHVKVVCK